jgi:hypothetical protein
VAAIEWPPGQLRRGTAGLEKLVVIIIRRVALVTVAARLIDVEVAGRRDAAEWLEPGLDALVDHRSWPLRVHFATRASAGQSLIRTEEADEPRHSMPYSSANRAASLSAGARPRSMLARRDIEDRARGGARGRCETGGVLARRAGCGRPS